MIKLHLGCGWRNFGPSWVHIDGGDYKHLDYYDIKKLYFLDESVDLIYASHVFEYFDLNEAKDVLSEWNRVLKPKTGILRLAVPNFEVMTKLYFEKQIPLSKFWGPLYGKMKMGNQTIYHKMVYDFNSLSELLINSGFTDIRYYNWRDTDHSDIDDHSQAYIPHMDKDNGTLISLNVEANKT